MAAEEIDLIQVTMAVQKLTDRMDAYLDHQTTANTNTVIHKTEGVGTWVAAAITACFMTYLALILMGVWTFFQVNDLRAWRDVHAAKIAVLEGKSK